MLPKSVITQRQGKVLFADLQIVSSWYAVRVPIWLMPTFVRKGSEHRLVTPVMHGAGFILLPSASTDREAPDTLRREPRTRG